jgi:hypothetical protein
MSTVLLTEPPAFDDALAECGGRREAVWQRFLEENPWILGISLAGQLLTSWDSAKLEQVVAGFSVGGSGKRTDALLRTSGRIRSLVFAEIKHHETPLLGANEYRPECWPASSELVGGVVQVQQTVDLAVTQLGKRLADIDKSFELYRRNLYEPEIITFDELLARAEWHVALAEQDVPPW